MQKVNKKSTIPLHVQLSSIIRNMIENNELKEEDSLIPERELCSIQNVSRMTVNKAIMSLVSEGLLYRVQGKGTFVSKKKKAYQFASVKGFTEVMKEKGVNIKTDILSFEMETPSDLVKEKLKIDDIYTNVYKVTRLRYIEDEPFGIEIVYLSESTCKGLTKGDLDNKSLYGVLYDKYGYRVKKANQVMEPIMVDEEESMLLEIPLDTLALRLHRNSYDHEENAIEYTISIFRSDKYQYEIILSE